MQKSKLNRPPKCCDNATHSIVDLGGSLILATVQTATKYLVAKRNTLPLLITTILLKMKTIHQTAVVAVSVAVAFIGFVSTVHAEARITSASKSASFAKTLRAAGSVSPNRRRLEEVVDDTIPTTCTDIPNGYEAFGVAAEDAFNSRNFEDDCHTMTGTEETIQDPIDDVYPSIQETTRVELCISNDQSTRYIFSNGLPDHPVVKSVNRPTHCIVPYAVALPTNPVYDATYLEETPIAGPMAFTVTNGIPIVDTAWAMRNGFLFSEEAWRGQCDSIHCKRTATTTTMTISYVYFSMNLFSFFQGMPTFVPFTGTTTYRKCLPMETIQLKMSSWDMPWMDSPSTGRFPIALSVDRGSLWYWMNATDW